MTPKVVVDEALCAGHGQCAGHAPDLFQLDDEGYCVQAGQGLVDIPDGQEDAARQAEDACPEGAIRVTDED